MLIRQPAAAGTFYPREADACLAQLHDCEQQAQVEGAAEVNGRIIGGIVPHAGWVCSGAVAAGVFERIAAQRQPAVAVVFGAIHVPVPGPQSYLFPAGAWQTPLGQIGIDERVCKRICDRSAALDCDPTAHAREHSIEVEVPFIQDLLPQCLIIPIMTAVTDEAAELGTAVGQACRDYGVDAIFLASTDLTHYGPSYGFAPQGIGSQGLAWAKQVNDRRMIDLILAMREQDAVKEATANHNACGPGAIAATIAACKCYGARHATLLRHTTSYEVLRERFGEPARDAVGYAGIVFHD